MPKIVRIAVDGAPNRAAVLYALDDLGRVWRGGYYGAEWKWELVPPLPDK